MTDQARVADRVWNEYREFDLNEMKEQAVAASDAESEDEIAEVEAKAKEAFAEVESLVMDLDTAMADVKEVCRE